MEEGGGEGGREEGLQDGGLDEGRGGRGGERGGRRGEIGVVDDEKAGACQKSNISASFLSLTTHLATA